MQITVEFGALKSSRAQSHTARKRRILCRANGLIGARESTLAVTVAILAQGTTSGDALRAALFCVPSVRTPVVRFAGECRSFSCPVRVVLLELLGLISRESEQRPREHTCCHRSHFGSRYHIGRCALRSPLLCPIGSNPGRALFSAERTASSAPARALLLSP